MFAPIRPSPTNPICIPETSCQAVFALRRPRAGLGQLPRSASARATSSRRRSVSGSARWTRTIGRSWDSIDSKSPWAWASISRPNVYGQPGIGRSVGWSEVSWRNQPIGAPPLWSWPVEWRKRGP
jgi:hypothetical protein